MKCFPLILCLLLLCALLPAAAPMHADLPPAETLWHDAPDVQGAETDDAIEQDSGVFVISKRPDGGAEHAAIPSRIAGTATVWRPPMGDAA